MKASRRLGELRAREWSTLVARARTSGTSLRRSTLAQVKKHPAITIGIGALVGLAIFAKMQGSKDQEESTVLLLDEDAKKELAVDAPSEARPARTFASVLTETLGKAAKAWLVSSLTHEPAKQT